MLLDISYQTYVNGFEATIKRKKRMACLKLPPQMGSYKIDSMKQAVMETKIFLVYCLGEFPYYRHDLNGIIKSSIISMMSFGNTCETGTHEEDYK